MALKKVVIPVAGKGTRFLPATKQIPKEMIPIINKPMIHYAVMEAVKAKVEEVIFVTSTGKEAIENYFDRNLELESFLIKAGKEEMAAEMKKIGTMIEVVSVRQKEQLGLGHAIACAKACVGSETFGVILGDDLILSDSPVVEQLYKVSEERSGASVIGVMEVPREQTFRYGIVDGPFIKGSDKTLELKAMVEKPGPDMAPTNLATPGRYILGPSIFEALKEIPKGAGGEYQLTDAINLLAQKEDTYAHIFEGDRFDTGNPESYLEATIEFALREEKTHKFMKDLIYNKYHKLFS